MLFVIHLTHTALCLSCIDYFQKYEIFHQFLHFCPQNSQKREKMNKKIHFTPKSSLFNENITKKQVFKTGPKLALREPTPLSETFTMSQF